MTYQTFLLIIASLIGIYCCWVFYIQEHKNLKQRFRSLPFCSDNVCSVMAETPYAKLAYFKNWSYGALFYGLVIVAALSGNRTLRDLAFLGSILSCIFSLVLIWALLFKLRMVCRVCYLAHTMNFILLLTLVKEIFY